MRIRIISVLVSGASSIVMSVFLSACLGVVPGAESVALVNPAPSDTPALDTGISSIQLKTALKDIEVDTDVTAEVTTVVDGVLRYEMVLADDSTCEINKQSSDVSQKFKVDKSKKNKFIRIKAILEKDGAKVGEKNSECVELIYAAAKFAGKTFGNPSYKYSFSEDLSTFTYAPNATDYIDYNIDYVVFEKSKVVPAIVGVAKMSYRTATGAATLNSWQACGKTDWQNGVEKIILPADLVGLSSTAYANCLNRVGQFGASLFDLNDAGKLVMSSWGSASYYLQSVEELHGNSFDMSGAIESYGYTDGSATFGDSFGNYLINKQVNKVDPYYNAFQAACNGACRTLSDAMTATGEWEVFLDLARSPISEIIEGKEYPVMFNPLDIGVPLISE